MPFELGNAKFFFFDFSGHALRADAGSVKFRLLSAIDAKIRESFCESEEGVRLPRETADLRGSPGKFRGSPGNFRGSLGNFRGTSALLFSSRVRGLPGNSPKTSREVRETSREVRGLSRSSEEPDSSQ